ncbi:MAG TPA: hypothetical protein VGE52_14015 [Pirellulales bacterium]
MAGSASVTVALSSKMQGTVVSSDVSPDGAFNASSKTRILSGWDADISLNGSTTPKAEQLICTKVTLSGGAATLDLTNITQVDGNGFDATGKKLVGYRFQNPNNNPVTVAPGASNGYDFAGAGKDVDVPAFEEIAGKPYKLGQAPSRAVVASGDRTLDFTGTGADSILVTLTFGS